MMISATELKPKTCLDCHNRLGESIYGRMVDRVKSLYGIRPYHDSYLWNSDNIYILCPCGAMYVWSYDETNFNGGIWKQRHILPLFDSKLRLEIARFQIARHLKSHSKIYSSDLLARYQKMVKDVRI